jgi:mannose-6-phosphate isomerase
VRDINLPHDIERCADDASSWLFNTAIPLWLEHGLDRNQGGFFDSLHLETLQNASPFKRLRVLTRQIYVFSEGARNGVPGARQAVELGLNYLFDRFRHPDGAFASRCDLHGSVIEPVRDLYDLSFTLFSLAHAYRLTKDNWLRDEADLLLAFLNDSMRHSGAGFVEALPIRLPRRQNPHMHLLEAALAWSDLSPTSGFLALCKELAHMCSSFFLDEGQGVIYEYFDDSLKNPEGGKSLSVVEPGHNFEWVWLISEYARVSGEQLSGCQNLYNFALKNGLNIRSGFLYGQLSANGQITSANVRIWPHCEWLRATLVMNEQNSSTIGAWTAIQRFLETPIQGLWFEHWDAAKSSFVSSPAPATSLYHLTTAITAFGSSHHASLNSTA